jgi:ferredoxin
MCKINELLNDTELTEQEKTLCVNQLNNQSESSKKLNKFIENETECNFTPVLILKEDPQSWHFIFPKKDGGPDGIGLKGSVLAHLRYKGFDDAMLPSDCFGQLSCSSCAIQVLYGKPKNEMRDEEYDMLSIDKTHPPTQHTRLGCQTVIGDNLLIIKVR